MAEINKANVNVDKDSDGREQISISSACSLKAALTAAFPKVKSEDGRSSTKRDESEIAKTLRFRKKSDTQLENREVQQPRMQRNEELASKSSQSTNHISVNNDRRGTDSFHRIEPSKSNKKIDTKQKVPSKRCQTEFLNIKEKDFRPDRKKMTSGIDCEKLKEKRIAAPDRISTRSQEFPFSKSSNPSEKPRNSSNWSAVRRKSSERHDKTYSVIKTSKMLHPSGESTDCNKSTSLRTKELNSGLTRKRNSVGNRNQGIKSATNRSKETNSDSSHRHIEASNKAHEVSTGTDSSVGVVAPLSCMRGVSEANTSTRSNATDTPTLKLSTNKSGNSNPLNNDTNKSKKTVNIRNAFDRFSNNKTSSKSNAKDTSTIKPSTNKSDHSNPLSDDISKSKTTVNSRNAFDRFSNNKTSSKSNAKDTSTIKPSTNKSGNSNPLLRDDISKSKTTVNSRNAFDRFSNNKTSSKSNAKDTSSIKPSTNKTGNSNPLSDDISKSKTTVNSRNAFDRFSNNNKDKDASQNNRTVKRCQAEGAAATDVVLETLAGTLCNKIEAAGALANIGETQVYVSKEDEVVDSVKDGNEALDHVSNKSDTENSTHKITSELSNKDRAENLSKGLPSSNDHTPKLIQTTCTTTDKTSDRNKIADPPSGLKADLMEYQSKDDGNVDTAACSITHQVDVLDEGVSITNYTSPGKALLTASQGSTASALLKIETTDASGSTPPILEPSPTDGEEILKSQNDEVYTISNCSNTITSKSNTDSETPKDDTLKSREDAGEVSRENTKPLTAKDTNPDSPEVANPASPKDAGTVPANPMSPYSDDGCVLLQDSPDECRFSISLKQDILAMSGYENIIDRCTKSTSNSDKESESESESDDNDEEDDEMCINRGTKYQTSKYRYINGMSSIALEYKIKEEYARRKLKQEWYLKFISHIPNQDFNLIASECHHLLSLPNKTLVDYKKSQYEYAFLILYFVVFAAKQNPHLSVDAVFPEVCKSSLLKLNIDSMFLCLVCFIDCAMYTVARRLHSTIDSIVSNHGDPTPIFNVPQTIYHTLLNYLFKSMSVYELTLLQINEIFDDTMYKISDILQEKKVVSCQKDPFLKKYITSVSEFIGRINILLTFVQHPLLRTLLYFKQFFFRHMASKGSHNNQIWF